MSSPSSSTPTPSPSSPEPNHTSPPVSTDGDSRDADSTTATHDPRSFMVRSFKDILRRKPDETARVSFPPAVLECRNKILAGIGAGGVLGAVVGFYRGRTNAIAELQRQADAAHHASNVAKAGAAAGSPAATASAAAQGSSRPRIDINRPEHRAFVSHAIGREMVRSSVLMCSRLGLFVSMFASIELVFSLQRNKRDAWNAGIAGLATGISFGAMQGGARGAVVGGLAVGGLAFALDFMRRQAEDLVGEEHFLPPPPPPIPVDTTLEYLSAAVKDSEQLLAELLGDDDDDDDDDNSTPTAAATGAAVTSTATAAGSSTPPTGSTSVTSQK